MNLPELKALGFSEGQISVYTAVLELGRAGLNSIQEKTGIERRNIYDILNKLIEKGLISYTVEKGRKTFQCTQPDKILEAINKKESELEELKGKMPQVKDLFNIAKTDISAEVFRGSEAIKSLLNEILDYKESYWFGGNNFNQMKSVTQEIVNWFGHWMKRRAKQKHMMYDLVQQGTVLESLHFDDITKQKRAYLMVKLLPKNFSSPMVVIIFGNKVAQVLWAKQPFAFVIESEEVRDSFKGYFNYFWTAC